ncbi:MAG: hypothetical protein HF314_09600 [Ignavibacteria bacterium]|nr:hypothetical protein [Ignavibacteria bacterium]MCU7503318.1 hypothetical protein [Ignavibacteria bacterium]MCU7515736.1 hypothetical protein [Ignavibacteria bacterium]
MKKLFISILLCFTLFQSFHYAQSVFGGFRVEQNFLGSNSLSNNRSSASFEPGLNLGLKIGEDFSLEGRWGVLLSDDLSGMQYGLYAKENILKDYIYLMGGISLLSSSGDAHGTLIYEESFSGTHTMLGGGIGFNASDNFAVELQYNKVLDEKFGFSSFWDMNGQPRIEYWKVYSIIKLGLAYNFSFTPKPGKEETVLGKAGATEESAVETAAKRRHIFLAGGTGFPDLINTQLGYQVLDFLSIAGVLNWDVYSRPEFKKFTGGLKLTGYFSGMAFNNISLEFSKHMENFFSGDSKGPIVLTLGNDNVSSRFLNFFWAAGMLMWYENGNIEGASPIFRIGTNFNF